MGGARKIFLESTSPSAKFPNLQKLILITILSKNKPAAKVRFFCVTRKILGGYLKPQKRDAAELSLLSDRCKC